MAELRHTLFFELRDALPGPGCVLCELGLRAMRRYFATLADEGVGDQRVRAEIREAHGFCSVHGRMMRESRDALGTAIVHRDVLTTLTRQLSAAIFHPPSVGARLRHAIRGGRTLHGPTDDALVPQRACPGCLRWEIIDRLHSSEMAKRLIDGELFEAFRDSAGMCVPHLRRILRLMPDPASYERIRDAQLAIWERLAAELDEFIRKQDYRFTHEPGGPESNSWARAVDLISGQPELGRMPRRDH